MGKNSNPADAFRKLQKKRELKKNATERKKKREDQTAKQDTRDLEAEIAYLKSNDKLSAEGKERLGKLEGELKYVSKLKEKYVAAHPEAKDKIYHTGDKRGPRHPQQHGRDEDDEGDRPDPMAHLYNPDGTLRDPKKSYYYDSTYNPFGVPPPGMPYRERVVTADLYGKVKLTAAPGPDDESSSDSDDDSYDDSDDEIVMPEGPRPDSDSDSDADSDDSMDIPLPDGPPPPHLPPALPMPPRHGHGHGHHGPSHGRGGRGGRGGPGGRPAPYPPRQQHDPANPGGWGALIPEAGPGPVRRGHPGVEAGAGSLPPRPTGLPAPPSSLPAKPGSAPAGPAIAAAPVVAASTTAAATAAPTAASAAAATISAAPQLRDLRKEATVFVPRGVGRKKAPGGLARVNAAPAAGAVDAEGDARVVRAPAGPGLMGKLSGVLGQSRPKEQDAGEDEYERFLEGLE